MTDKKNLTRREALTNGAGGALSLTAALALLNIKDRYLDKQRMGATGEELKALQALVDVSRDFWMRQSGELFRAANVALDKARGFVRERKAA